MADLETRPLQFERVEIGELLDEVVDLLDTPERISLDVQAVPWAIPPIEGDRELLLIVFRNLVDNALKYSGGDWDANSKALPALLREVKLAINLKKVGSEEVLRLSDLPKHRGDIFQQCSHVETRRV